MADEVVPSGNATSTPQLIDDGMIEAPPGYEDFMQFCGYALTVCSFVGFLLNLCVIVFSRKLRQTTGDLTHNFVCSMACADLLLCCFAQPFEFVTGKLATNGIVTMAPSVCRLQHAIYYLSLSASGVSLTLLNLDKLVFFKWPLHYGMIGTTRVASLTIAVAWLTCTAAAVCMSIPETLNVTTAIDCSSLHANDVIYVSYSIAFGFVPVVSSAVVSVYLAALVQKMQRSTGGYSTALYSDYTIQQRLRAMAFIFMTTAWTFVALTPYRLYCMFRLFLPNVVYRDVGTTVWVGYIFLVLLTLNASVNPGLTLIAYAPYKNCFKAFLFKCKFTAYKWLARHDAEALRKLDAMQSAKDPLTQSEWL